MLEVSEVIVNAVKYSGLSDNGINRTADSSRKALCTLEFISSELMGTGPGSGKAPFNKIPEDAKVFDSQDLRGLTAEQRKMCSVETKGGFSKDLTSVGLARHILGEIFNAEKEGKHISVQIDVPLGTEKDVADILGSILMSDANKEYQKVKVFTKNGLDLVEVPQHEAEVGIQMQTLPIKIGLNLTSRKDKDSGEYYEFFNNRKAAENILSAYEAVDAKRAEELRKLGISVISYDGPGVKTIPEFEAYEHQDQYQTLGTAPAVDGVPMVKVKGDPEPIFLAPTEATIEALKKKDPKANEINKIYAGLNVRTEKVFAEVITTQPSLVSKCLGVSGPTKKNFIAEPYMYKEEGKEASRVYKTYAQFSKLPEEEKKKYTKVEPQKGKTKVWTMRNLDALVSRGQSKEKANVLGKSDASKAAPVKEQEKAPEMSDELSL